MRTSGAPRPGTTRAGPFRLIATDIDGTLLTDGRLVTPRTRAVLDELGRRGVRVVLSTARPPREIGALYEDLGLSDPVIAYNGALVYDPRGEAVLMHHPMPTATALAALAAIRAAAAGLNVGLEMADAWHVDRIDERLRRLLDAGIFRGAPMTGDLEGAIATGRGVSKLYFAATDPVRAAVEEVLGSLRGAVGLTSSASGFVEVHAAGVSKGAALRALAATLGIPMHETLALGDQENDIPALRVAGLGVAMGHAPAPVKAAAGAVTGTNADDGWAEAVERYVLEWDATPGAGR